MIHNNPTYGNQAAMNNAQLANGQLPNQVSHCGSANTSHTIYRVPETAYDFNQYADDYLDEAITYLGKEEKLPLHLEKALSVMRNLQRKRNVQRMNSMAPEKLAQFMAAFEKTNGEIEAEVEPVEGSQNTIIDALKQADNALQKAIDHFANTNEENKNV